MDSAANSFHSSRPDDGGVMAESFAKSSDLPFLYNGDVKSATISIHFEVKLGCAWMYN